MRIIVSNPLLLNKATIETANEYHKCLSKLSAEFPKYKAVSLTYMDKLAEYVKFICDTRKIGDPEAIQLIHDCKMKISQLQSSDVAKIKNLFDEILVNGIKKYAHSETAFLYYCYKTKVDINNSVLFTIRDMCPICEDTLAKMMEFTNQGIIIVSTQEHENSWNRHNPLSRVKKVVIDTAARFNTNLSSLTDELRITELKTEIEKLFSPRGISLLFQQSKVPPLFSLSFPISDNDFLQALGDKAKQIKRNPMLLYALDSKLTTLSMLIKIYQCVFSKNYLEVNADIITETKEMISSPLFSHMNQELLNNYMDYIIVKLK